MRTLVKISFGGDHVMGGAAAVLGPAGCGPDVARIDDVPALRKIFVDVTLEKNDPRLPILITLLQAQGVKWWRREWDEYTDAERETARLLIVVSNGESQVFGGPRMGTSYDLSGACSICGAGARQTSALIIDGEELNTFEGRALLATYYEDFMVSDRLAEKLEALDVRGMTLRPVYARMKEQRQIRMHWKQICATKVLPPRSPKTTGLTRIRECRCGRSGMSSDMFTPTRLAYRREDIEDIDDVNLTWEWYGEVDFRGDVSRAVFPYPWLLVTPKVWRVFRDAGVTEVDFLPIRVVED